MALDAGAVRIGIAVSDPLGITAQPHSSVRAEAPDLMSHISRLVDALGVDQIVVGLPISLDGSEGPAARAAREFAAKVGAAVDIDVSLYDERFSTVTAEKAMIEAGARREARKEKRDRVAAAVFLQAYLDGRR